MLTGKEIWSLRIIENGTPEKIDDGIVPSYGLDGMLYTFRGLTPQDYNFLYLAPLQFVIVRTLESVRMPLNCGGLLTIKSRYGRKGIILTTASPIDPGYHGVLAMGLFNGNADTQVIDMRGGIMQMTVHAMSEKVPAYAGIWQQ